MQSMVRIVALLACLVSLAGCSPSSRIAKDGYTLVPLEGLGTGLPRDGVVPKGDEGPIHFDSLYAMKDVDRFDQQECVRYLRFWSTGQVLMRLKPTVPWNQGESLPLVTARDGDVVDDWLAGPSLPNAAAVGTVGRYVVVGTEVYIEFFKRLPDGADFADCAGQVAQDGFILDRVRYRNGPFPRWKSMGDKWHLVRCPVGEMRGTPTW